MSSKKIYIHHAPIMVWHWVNAVGFVFLILTGFQIRFAEHLDFITLDGAIYLHNYVGFMVIPNYLMWLIYALGTKQIHNYIPTTKNIYPRIKEQIIYYAYGIFKGQKNPHTITEKNKLVHSYLS